MNLNKLIRLTLENEGASLSLNSGIFNPNVGFFASYMEFGFVIKLIDFNEVNVLSYIIRNEAILRENGNFIGTWIDSNLVYLDVSKQFASESEGREFAIANKQLAYYDAEKGIVKTLRRKS